MENKKKKEKEKEVRKFKFKGIDEDITKTIKVILLGESGVGIIGIINRFISNNIDTTDTMDTIYASYFYDIILEFPELESSIRFDIWDAVGLKNYSSLSKIFYKDASVIILVYDITDEYSFESIKDHWYKVVKNNCENNPILAVVANKCELFEKEHVSEEEASEFAKEIGAIFQLISVANNWGIDELFYNIGMTYLTGNMNFHYDSLEKEKVLDIKKEKTFNKKKCIII